MSALLKLETAIFGGSLTSLSLFKNQSSAEADYDQRVLDHFPVHQADTVSWKYIWET